MATASRNNNDACMGCNLKTIDIGYICYTSRTNCDKLYKFLTKHNVLPSTHKCKKCGKDCNINYKQGVFSCNKQNLDYARQFRKKPKPCNYKLTIFKGTFFDNVSLPKWKIFNFIYLYLSIQGNRTPFIANDISISTSTYCDWSNFVREVCIDWASRHANPIGGEGVIVAIDESEFWQPKNKRGKIVSRQWVLGGVEQNNIKKQFFVPLESRDRKTLIKLVKTYVKPGSIIYSAFCWKAYEDITEEDFACLSIIYSINFDDSIAGTQIRTSKGKSDDPMNGAQNGTNQYETDDPETSMYTRNIQKLWSGLRANVPQYGRREHHFEGYLAEARFRQTFPTAGKRFHEFWKAAGVLYPFDG